MYFIFFFKQKTAYEMRISDWSSDVCSSDLLMVVHLLSPDKRYSELYIANYMNLRIREQLLRLEGVGNVTVFGGSEYAMRIWLDPARLSSYGLAASDVVAALQAPNIQVSGGTLGSQPAPVDTPLQAIVTTQGRLDRKSPR